VVKRRDPAAADESTVATDRPQLARDGRYGRLRRWIGTAGSRWRALRGADIRDVLDRLSPEHRAALVLRDVESLDEREVAGLLNVPAGTVKSRLHRARASFRRAWTS
jgi:RNA polymerase sigma-70 factor (ECF subfamily)